MITRTRTAFLAGVAATVVFFGFLPRTSAVLVQNIVGGVTNVVFFDNFENDTLETSYGFPFLAWPQHPEAGLWTNFSSGNISYAAVTNAPLPGPADVGTQYLQMTRGPRPNGAADLGGKFTSLASSGTLSASFYLFLPVGSPDFDFLFSLSTVANTLGGYGADLADVTAAGGYVNYLNNQTTYSNTTVAVQYGVWQKWQIDYTFLPGPNNDYYTISVNGVSTPQIKSGGAFSLPDQSFQYLDFYTGAYNGTFYVDGVPEPSVTGLISIGFIGIFRLRSVRRKETIEAGDFPRCIGSK